MANNKENLAQWLLIEALLESDKSDKIKVIAKKMVRELETGPNQEKESED